MPKIDRGRYLIDRAGPWRLYVSGLPPGWQVLGTVQRAQTIGALLRDPVGAYWCRAGPVLDRLIDRKVTAALEATG